MTQKEELLHLIDEMILTQKEKVLKCGRELVPNLTSEDVLQPIDYPELENNPYFRHEEGILEGMHTIKSALAAFFSI